MGPLSYCVHTHMHTIVGGKQARHEAHSKRRPGILPRPTSHTDILCVARATHSTRQTDVLPRSTSNTQRGTYSKSQTGILPRSTLAG